MQQLVDLQQCAIAPFNVSQIGRTIAAVAVLI